MTDPYHNKLLICFSASDSRVLLYLKQNSETKEYAVIYKKYHMGVPDRRVLLTTFSLSSAMRALAEEIGVQTNGFTTWRKL